MRYFTGASSARVGRGGLGIAAVLQILPHGLVVVIEVGGKNMLATIKLCHKVQIIVRLGVDGSGKGRSAERTDGAWRQAGALIGVV